MNNVIKMFPSTDIPETLRRIADQVEAGEFKDNDCTIILGLDVFHIGNSTEETAAPNAIFNMTYGIQKLMRPLLEVDYE